MSTDAEASDHAQGEITMTDKYSEHTLYAVAYSVIGEEHTDYYIDFAKAVQDFDTYRKELTGQLYHQSKPEDVAFYIAHIYIPAALVFLNDEALVSYVNSPDFDGTITNRRIEYPFMPTTARYMH